MSLRARLLLIIGLPFILLWATASTWMLVDLRSEFQTALDERLAASAHMVASLTAKSPPLSAMSPFDPAVPIGAAGGVACEIRLLRGGIVSRTANSPAQLGSAVPGYRTRTIDGERWRSFTLEENGLRVTTADRVDRRQQLLHGVAAAAALPVLIAVAGSLMALWFGVRTGLAPIESIRAALAARAPDALHAVHGVRVPDELSPLVIAINALLARVAGAIERERRFTGDAAHELRTPLTAVKTHIQVARLSHNADDKDRALMHAEEGVLRLQHTIEQLLMLSRLDGPFEFDNDDGANAAAAINAAVAQIAPLSRCRVAVGADNTQGSLAVPAALVETALRNLLDNALRYSPAGTEVLVRFTAMDGAIIFHVEDRGSGMSPDDAERAVERFWRAGRGEGSGLGLSIVTAIAHRFGGALHLAHRPGGGLIAQLRLPAAA